jgi:hypothetical protein
MQANYHRKFDDLPKIVGLLLKSRIFIGYFHGIFAIYNEAFIDSRIKTNQ